jgi:aminoglycoside phosphotransferase (APT) family kinase protein
MQHMRGGKTRPYHGAMPDVGPLFATGRTAEVFEYGPDKLVKVLRPGFGEDILTVEEQACAALAAAGAPVTKTFGRLDHDGRPGLIMERLDGQDMNAMIKRRLWRAGALATMLAGAHASIHQATAPGLPDVKDRLAAKIDGASGVLGFTEREAAKGRLRVLPGGDRLLHGDLHPGNVLMAGSGAVPIDWPDATRGPVAPDLVRTLWLLSAGAVPDEGPRRRLILMIVNRFRHRYQAEYERLTGLDRRTLAPWRLPVLAARLSEGIAHEEVPLAQAVRALAR